ncbi:MAG TPA: ribosome maturation factor RimP [Methylomirabilota bacterium]|jgi:ribosome maturation factor RimP|nr:ribosome maturation factor RimP [Methylomirabilota bacterium]
MQDDEKQLEIEGVVQPVLHDHGLTLVDLEWRPRRPRGVLRLYVDKPGGVGIDDCQRVSREVGDVLDASALIEEAYDLEVSSPGLDRQLRKEREFRWAVGKRVRCWLAGGEEVRGRLRAVDDGQVFLEQDGGTEVQLDLASVTKAKLDAEVPWGKRSQQDR